LQQQCSTKCRFEQVPAALLEQHNTMGHPIEVQPDGAEQEEAPSLGFFFKGAGALKFSAAVETEVPGSSQTVVVADRFGVVVFSDLQGACLASGAAAAAAVGGGVRRSNLGRVHGTANQPQHARSQATQPLYT